MEERIWYRTGDRALNHICINFNPSGSFRVSPGSIGATDEEIEQFTKGELPEGRVESLLASVSHAMFILSGVEPHGKC